jgi:hypothetical protein
MGLIHNSHFLSLFLTHHIFCQLVAKDKVLKNIQQKWRQRREEVNDSQQAFVVPVLLESLEFAPSQVTQENNVYLLLLVVNT